MTDICQFHQNGRATSRMGGATSRMGGATSSPYPALPSRFQTLLYAAGRGRLTPYQSEDPSPTLPTYRGKEEKGKIVKNKKIESN